MPVLLVDDEVAAGTEARVGEGALADAKLQLLGGELICWEVGEACHFVRVTSRDGSAKARLGSSSNLGLLLGDVLEELKYT